MDSSFQHNPITKRFLKAYYFLVKNGEVENDANFLEKMGHYSKSTFSQIKNEVRNAPVAFLNKFCDEFAVSRDYIFSGVGNIKPSENIVNEPLEQYKTKSTIDILAETLSKAVDALSIENQSLRRKVDEKDIIIYDYIKFGKTSSSSKAS
jgi:hypothetical protein